ncbi:MAG: TIGR03751 family conjugal transfer lipoprotein [Oleispira sp.]|nr:TIGR03751 family conjugal transfer lipoprotein [Oleispira sp.]
MFLINARSSLSLSLATGCLLLLWGCSTSQDSTLPQPNTNVKAVWQQQTGGMTQQKINDVRATLRTSLTPSQWAQRQSGYTRDSFREVANQFPRLPNPDVVMFILPHRKGAMPVPGYSTVFPLYERVHYATPGDRQALPLLPSTALGAH